MKTKKKKNILLLAVIAVVILGGGASAFSFFSKAGSNEGHKKEEARAVEEGVTFPLDPFIVNLSDPRGTRFLKVAIQFEVANAPLAEKAKARTPQIRDMVITILTSKSAEALISPEGKQQFKDELNIGVSQILGEKSVKNVYFTDFVTQLIQ